MENKGYCRMKIIKSFISLLIIFSFIGCTPKQDIHHPENIPNEDINKSIQLIAPKAWNTFKPSNSVGLQVVNNSNQNITFNQSFNKQIFLIKNDQLIEIEDEMVIINGQNTILKPNESAGVTFRIKSENKKTALRIYVTGTIDGTNTTAVAYIDILLTP